MISYSSQATLRSSELESKLLLVEMEHRQSRDAQEDLSDCRQQVVVLESDLKIEREWRKQLQGTNRQQGERIEQLAEEVLCDSSLQRRLGVPDLGLMLYCAFTPIPGGSVEVSGQAI